MKKHISIHLRRKKVGGKTGGDWDRLDGSGRSVRMLSRRDSPQGRSLASHDLRPDEISATGGHRPFALLTGSV